MDPSTCSLDARSVFFMVLVLGFWSPSTCSCSLVLGVDARRVLGEHERIKFSIINVKITVSNRKKKISPLYQLIKKLSTDKVKHKKYEVKNESKKKSIFS